jgi:hypothetical protein
MGNRKPEMGIMKLVNVADQVAAIRLFFICCFRFRVFHFLASYPLETGQVAVT